MITRSSALRSVAAAVAAAALPHAAGAAERTLSVGQIGNNSIAFFPLFVAQERGLLKSANLDVTITNFTSGAVLGAAVTSGSVDVACGVITDVFSLIKASRPVKVVGSLVDGYYVDVIGSDAFMSAAKVDRKSSLAAKTAALKGKKIGITGPGSGTEALVVYLCKQAGIDPQRDLELVNVGTDQAAILTQLKTGRLDAVSFAWPLSMVAEAQHIGRALVMPAAGDVPAMRGELQGVMYAKPETIAKRADAVAAFVRAIGLAQRFIIASPKDARALLNTYDSQLDPAIIDRLDAAYLPVLAKSPRVSVAAYEKALAFHKITGYATGTGDSYRDVVAADLMTKALR